MSVPRGSNQSKTKAKQEAFKFILEYANRPGMESFTSADIAPFLPAPNMAATHLREMVDSNLLSCRGAATASYHYSKKPTMAARMKWRVTPDSVIGIKPSNLLGSAGR